MKNSLTVNLDEKLILTESKDLHKDSSDLIETIPFKPYLIDIEVSSIDSISITLDGKNIISGGYQHIKLWDIKSGECIKLFKGHSGCVHSVLITPNGKEIVSASNDNTIKIWDIKSGKCINTIDGNHDVVSLAITPDGRSIIYGGVYGHITLIDKEKPDDERSFYGHNDWVGELKITSNGMILISGCCDDTIKIWDIKSGKCLKTIECKSVVSLAITPNGETLISGSSDCTIKIWDITSGECLKTLRGHTCDISSLIITPDGKNIISGSGDTFSSYSENTIKIWNIESGDCVRTLDGYFATIWALDITPNGKNIISGGKDGYIKLWNIKSGECIYTTYNMKDNSSVTLLINGYFNSNDENIENNIRIDDISTSCRKLTKEEIIHFCKVKYKTNSFDKNYTPNIDVSTQITTTLKKEKNEEEDYWNEFF